MIIQQRESERSEGFSLTEYPNIHLMDLPYRSQSWVEKLVRMVNEEIMPQVFQEEVDRFVDVASQFLDAIDSHEWYFEQR
jgi:hypothetical protein